MSRRASGEGGIYPIYGSDGKIRRYGGAIELGYVNGRRKRKKIERKTRREVAEEIARLKAQLAKGSDLRSKQPTVKEFCTPWLADTFALKAKPKSVETYRQTFLYHIFPKFGNTKLNKLTHRMVQSFILELHKAGFADKTISLVRAAGRQAYKAAMKEGAADHNPFQDLTLPTGNAKAVQSLTVEQARALLQAAHGDRLEVALRLMLSLGLRRGEVCGLRWVDVDLEKSSLSVNGTLTYVRGMGLVWGEPKTKSSKRSFKLPPSLIAALKWHKQLQEQERKRMGKLWKDSGYVFVTTTTGGALNSNAIYVSFKKAADAIGLSDGFSPHCLRHSCASFLHAEGASLKNISVYLGHANTNITSQIYVHLFQTELDESTVTMEKILSTGT